MGNARRVDERIRNGAPTCSQAMRRDVSMGNGALMCSLVRRARESRGNGASRPLMAWEQMRARVMVFRKARNDRREMKNEKRKTRNETRFVFRVSFFGLSF